MKAEGTCALIVQVHGLATPAMPQPEGRRQLPADRFIYESCTNGSSRFGGPRACG
jgi:hypothetical protein